MDRKAQLGYLSCRVCQCNFQAPINYLSEPVDVYSDWVDAAEEINNGGGGIDTGAGDAGPSVEAAREAPTSFSLP